MKPPGPRLAIIGWDRGFSGSGGWGRSLEEAQPPAVGRRSRKDASYVGRSGDSCVWVCVDGREQLTGFTLTVLKFSSLTKETQTLINPGSVKFSPGTGAADEREDF